MYQINNLTNEYKQQTQWISNNGENITLYLEYKVNQLGWFITITYNDTVFNNIRVTNHYNMLRSYNSYLPFGIACTTTDGLEPMGIDDFASGYANLYMLTKDECKQIESDFYEKV